MCLFIPPQIVASILANAQVHVAKNFLPLTLEEKGGSLLRVGGVYCSGRFEAKHNPDPYASRAGQVSRTVYDAENRQSLPGKVVREEGAKSKGDKQVDEAYDFSGHTHEFFKKFFKRDSIDDKGFHLHSTVHFGNKYPNAFWNGRSMTYGDGDGEIFNPFTILDVVAHELTHGVTEHTAGLEYYSQSGALNEHFSDVFGSLVKQHVHNQTADKANWIIGEGLFTKNVQGRGIRDMLNPGTAYNDPIIGKDRQPNHIKDIYTGGEDNGGVHLNSGIMNRIFANFSINIGGYAFDKPAKIWYEVLTTKLSERSNFQDMVNATQEVVIQNYGTGIEYKAFKEAAKVVGLTPRHHIFRGMGLKAA